MRSINLGKKGPERPPRSMRPFCVDGITGRKTYGLRHFCTAGAALSGLAKTTRRTDITADSAWAWTPCRRYSPTAPPTTRRLSKPSERFNGCARKKGPARKSPVRRRKRHDVQLICENACQR
ncbi:hypothetical protein EFR84_32265 [Rhizobium chutanense]|uniref:Uncharacterized protein n=1 Tax=Rhizobium chutanense TaxID=2035448 RepID=A0A3S0RYT2_9HYPH|nr:hypothetical protein EFR84_32265 [Rhizobium chutanense]